MEYPLSSDHLSFLVEADSSPTAFCKGNEKSDGKEGKCNKNNNTNNQNKIK